MFTIDDLPFFIGMEVCNDFSVATKVEVTVETKHHASTLCNEFQKLLSVVHVFAVVIAILGCCTLEICFLVSYS